MKIDAAPKHKRLRDYLTEPKTLSADPRSVLGIRFFNLGEFNVSVMGRHVFSVNFTPVNFFMFVPHFSIRTSALILPVRLSAQLPDPRHQSCRSLPFHNFHIGPKPLLPISWIMDLRHSSTFTVACVCLCVCVNDENHRQRGV